MRHLSLKEHGGNEWCCGEKTISRTGRRNCLTPDYCRLSEQIEVKGVATSPWNSLQSATKQRVWNGIWIYLYLFNLSINLIYVTKNDDEAASYLTSLANGVDGSTVTIMEVDRVWLPGPNRIHEARIKIGFNFCKLWTKWAWNGLSSFGLSHTIKIEWVWIRNRFKWNQFGLKSIL